MGSFNQKRFLRCFDQLADLEESSRNQAVRQLLADLSLPPNASDDETNLKNRNSKQDSKESDHQKNPLSPKRTYKFRYTVKEHNLLQYTLERLIRGLKADRKCSRIGFTFAFSSVLASYGDDIEWAQVIKAILEYTSQKDCTSSEIKDVICGRLYMLFILQWHGFFCKPQAIEYLEPVCNSVWESYDCKSYFQDASCTLLWLICRDIYRTTKDVGLTLRHVESRLSKVLNREILKTTQVVNDDTKEEKDQRKAADKNDPCKGKTTALQCALFGLYLKLHQEISSGSKELMKGSVIDKSPLDNETFPIALRYVFCIPGNYPVVDSFFSALLDCIVNSPQAEERLKQLWNSINLTMLDVHSGCTPQRRFTGIRLASMIFLKVKNSPALLLVLCQGAKNFFGTVSRCHKAPKGDVTKGISRNVVQLLVNAVQCADEGNIFETIDNPSNVTVNDYVMYTRIEKILSGAVGKNLENSKDALTRMDTKDKRKQETSDQKLDDTNTDPSSSKANIARLLPDECVSGCIVAIAESLDYSAAPLAFWQNLFGALIRASMDIAQVYKLLESQIREIDVIEGGKKLHFILTMLQLCVTHCNKDVRAELFERYFATNAFSIPLCCNHDTSKGVSLVYFAQNLHKYRALLVCRGPKDAVDGGELPEEMDEEMSNSINKPELLSARLRSSCFSILSRALNAIPNTKKDMLKMGVARTKEALSLTESLSRLYQAMEYLNKNCNNFVLDKSKDDEFHLPRAVLHPSAKSVKTKNDRENRNAEHVELPLGELSRKLLNCCERLKENGEENDPRSVLIRLYGSTMSLMLFLLHSQPIQFSSFPIGASVAPGDRTQQNENSNMPIVRSFAELLVTALESKNPSSIDAILKAIMSDTLLETILSDDNSAEFGLVRTLSKAIWCLCTPYITEELREKLLNSSLLDTASYDRSAFDVEEESESEMEENYTAESQDEDEDEEDIAEEEQEDDEEDGYQDTIDNMEAEEEDSEDEGGSESSESDEEDEHDSKRPRKDENMESDEESDIELSGAEALEELMKEEEGGLESLRMERLKLRMAQDLSPDALKHKLRNLDMLESCITDCTLDTWYVDMVFRLYSGYQDAVASKGRKLESSSHALLVEYTRKLGRVLEESVRYASMRSSTDHTTSPEGSHDSVKARKDGGNTAKVDKGPNFADESETMSLLLRLSLQVIDGQSMERTAKECRNQAVGAFLFSLRMESIISKVTPVQTRMVLLSSLLSAALCKNSKLGTNFFVQLAKRSPMEYAYIDLLKIALETKVEFIQSELIGICNMVVEAMGGPNSPKFKRLCRRRSGKAIDTIMSEHGVVIKGAPSKEKVVSFITDDVSASALAGLPSLFRQMKERYNADSKTDDTEESGKRSRKANKVSPILLKTASRLVTSIVKTTTPKESKLRELKNSMEELLNALSVSNKNKKQSQPLQAAVSKLSSSLG